MTHDRKLSTQRKPQDNYGPVGENAGDCWKQSETKILENRGELGSTTPKKHAMVWERMAPSPMNQPPSVFLLQAMFKSTQKPFLNANMLSV